MFFFFWLRWVFVVDRGLSLVAACGGYSLLWCLGFSLQWLLLLQSTGSRRAGSVVVACGLSSCGSQAYLLCGMWDTAQTHVPCIGRWILNHCATREVPQCCLLITFINTHSFLFLIQCYLTTINIESHLGSDMLYIIYKLCISQSLRYLQHQIQTPWDDKAHNDLVPPASLTFPCTFP